MKVVQQRLVVHFYNGGDSSLFTIQKKCTLVFARFSLCNEKAKAHPSQLS